MSRRRPPLDEKSSRRVARLRGLFTPSSEIARTYKRHWRLLEEQHEDLLHITGVFWKLTLILVAVLLGIRGSASVFSILSVSTGDVVIDLVMTLARSAVAILPLIFAIRLSTYVAGSRPPIQSVHNPYFATLGGLSFLGAGIGSFVYSFATPFTDGRAFAGATTLDEFHRIFATQSPEWVLSYALGHVSNIALTLFSLALIGLAIVLLFPIGTLFQEQVRRGKSTFLTQMKRLMGFSSKERTRTCSWCAETSFHVVETSGTRVIRCKNCGKSIHSRRSMGRDGFKKKP